jgi:molecular chaperone DnaK (HSP70)
MNARRIYGIDLGTTYSCTAHVDEHGKPVVLANAEGEMTTPLVVFFESPENIVAGQEAKEVVSIHPDLCVSTVKRARGDSQPRVSAIEVTLTLELDGRRQVRARAHEGDKPVIVELNTATLSHYGPTTEGL